MMGILPILGPKPTRFENSPLSGGEMKAKIQPGYGLHVYRVIITYSITASPNWRYRKSKG
jgi:hypothetical protein